MMSKKKLNRVLKVKYHNFFNFKFAEVVFWCKTKLSSFEWNTSTPVTSLLKILASVLYFSAKNKERGASELIALSAPSQRKKARKKASHETWKKAEDFCVLNV